ncbi:hypothetical protein BC830DRAFT_1129362 [Chytriomyces sp. MP71]|nr:hypothetical protein BC830DRAFT_1129362 [Chytriomyces sp. MP71]
MEPRRTPTRIYARSARPEDAAELATVHIASWNETFTGIFPATVIAETNARRPEMYKRLCAANNPSNNDTGNVVGVAVAEWDSDSTEGSTESKLIGLCIMGPWETRDPAFAGYLGLLALYILKDFHGCGAAKILLRATAGLLGWKTSSEVKMGLGRGVGMICECSAANGRAFRFYEKTGATEVSRSTSPRLADAILLTLKWDPTGLEELLA